MAAKWVYRVAAVLTWLVGGVFFLESRLGRTIGPGKEPDPTMGPVSLSLLPLGLVGWFCGEVWVLSERVWQLERLFPEAVPPDVEPGAARDLACDSVTASPSLAYASRAGGRGHAASEKASMRAQRVFQVFGVAALLLGCIPLSLSPSKADPTTVAASLFDVHLGLLALLASGFAGLHQRVAKLEQRLHAAEPSPGAAPGAEPGDAARLAR